MTPWEIVASVSGVVTAGVAILVWFEARAIRRTEWLSRSVAMWQAFNSELLHDDLAKRWAAFLAGSVPEDDIERRDLHVLYAYVNILYTEYQLASAHLISPAYAEQSIGGNIKQLASCNRDFIVRSLLYTGYDKNFVALIKSYPDMIWPWNGRLRRVRVLDRLPARRESDSRTSGASATDGHSVTSDSRLATRN